jgi:hypothetical protein
MAQMASILFVATESIPERPVFKRRADEDRADGWRRWDERPRGVEYQSSRSRVEMIYLSGRQTALIAVALDGVVVTRLTSAPSAFITYISQCWLAERSDPKAMSLPSGDHLG